MSIENQYQTPSSNVDGANSDAEYSKPKFFAVSGRLGRLRYIAYGIALNLVSFVMLMVVMMIGGGFAAIAGIGGRESSLLLGGGVMLMLLFMFILLIAMFVLGVMLMIQRCHDFNVTGWLWLIIFIPLTPLVFLFVPGTDGANDYGNKPPPNSGGVIALVVVGGVIFFFYIVGIIAAISVPAYKDYVETAAERAVQIEQAQ